MLTAPTRTAATRRKAFRRAIVLAPVRDARGRARADGSRLRVALRLSGTASPSPCLAFSTPGQLPRPNDPPSVHEIRGLVTLDTCDGMGYELRERDASASRRRGSIDARGRSAHLAAPGGDSTTKGGSMINSSPDKTTSGCRAATRDAAPAEPRLGTRGVRRDGVVRFRPYVVGRSRTAVRARTSSGRKAVPRLLVESQLAVHAEVEKEVRNQLQRLGGIQKPVPRRPPRHRGPKASNSANASPRSPRARN